MWVRSGVLCCIAATGSWNRGLPEAISQVSERQCRWTPSQKTFRIIKLVEYKFIRQSEFYSEKPTDSKVPPIWVSWWTSLRMALLDFASPRNSTLCCVCFCWTEKEWRELSLLLDKCGQWQNQYNCLAQEKVASRTGTLAQAEALERAVNTTTAAIYTAQLDSVALALRLLYYGERLSFHDVLNSGYTKV